MIKKLFAIIVCITMLLTLFLPSLSVVAETAAKTVVFEFGEITYNENFGELEVPLYIVENNSNVYTAEIYVVSKDGLECTYINEGNIKDSYDSGRGGVVEFGFNYTTNPESNLLLLDSAVAEYGIDTTGLVATFSFSVPEGFNEADIEKYTFDFGERTKLVAFDYSRPQAILKKPVCKHLNTKDEIIKAPQVGVIGLKNVVCANCNVILVASAVIPALSDEEPADPNVDTVVFAFGEITYNSSFNEIDVPLYVIENNSNIYTAEIYVVSKDGLECTYINEGNIKDSYDSGRGGVVEFGFNYTTNPESNLLLLDSAVAEYGIDTIGLVATFSFSVPEGFDEADIKNYSFGFGERTKLVAFDYSRPQAILKENGFSCSHSVTKEVITKQPQIGVIGYKNIVCADCDEIIKENIVIPAIIPELDENAKTIEFKIGRITYYADKGEIEVPIFIIENNSDIYSAELVLESEQEFACVDIVSGTIKDGNFGFNYTTNPSKNRLVVDSANDSQGISTNGYVASFFYSVPKTFKEADIADLEFSFGERTLLVAFDDTYSRAILTNEGIIVCDHSKTVETVTKDPDCVNDGEKRIECLLCSNVEYTIGEKALGHSYDGDCDGICNRCDATRTPLKAHNFTLNNAHTCSVCKYSKTPSAPVVLNVTADTVELVATQGFEYSIDGVTWQTSGLFEGLEAETEYSFYQRVAKSNVADESEISNALKVTTESDYVRGDVNGDGAVDAADLRLLKLVIANFVSVDDPSVKNVEVDNEPGIPNASDLRLLKLIIANLV